MSADIEGLLRELNARLADMLAAQGRAAEIVRQLARTMPVREQEVWGLVDARLAVLKRHLVGVLDPIGRQDAVPLTRSISTRRPKHGQ